MPDRKAKSEGERLPAPPPLSETEFDLLVMLQRLLAILQQPSMNPMLHNYERRTVQQAELLVRRLKGAP